MGQWGLWHRVAIQLKGPAKKLNTLKMTNNNILQWNCRGLTANFPELDLLLQTYSPAAICLQETFQNDTKPFNLRKYSHFYKNHLKNDGRPGGGVSIFIKRTIPHSHIQLNTPLQATAVRIS